MSDASSATPAPASAEALQQREPLDLRLLPAAAAAWTVAWLTPALSGGARWIVPLLALPAAAALFGRAWRDRGEAGRGIRTSLAATVAAVLACAGAAGIASAARAGAVESGPVPELAAQHATVRVEAKVRGYPTIQRSRTTRPGAAREFVAVPVEVRTVVGRGKTSQVHAPVVLRSPDLAWRTVLPGQQVAATGRFGPAQPRTPTSAMLWTDDPPAVLTEPPWGARAAARARTNMHDAVAGLGEPQRGLLPGLVLGDTSGTDPELAEDFKVAGLAHLVAVSGSNVMILIAVVLGAARWVGMRRVLLPPLGVVTILGFAAVVGPEPSLLRAAVMGLVAVLALGLGRPRRAAPALLASVVVLLLADPWLARSYGFALSAAATAGLLTLAPRWTESWSPHVPRPVAAILAVPTAAQVACAPLIVLLAGNVSLVAIPANLLALPAVAPAMCFGLIAAAVQSVSPASAGLLAQPAGLSAWWIVQVARTAAELPGPSLDWPNGIPGAVALGCATAAVVLFGPLLRRHLREGPPTRERSDAAEESAPPRVSDSATRAGRALLVLALVLTGCLVVRPDVPLPGPLRALHWPPPNWELVACDVGQGDGLVLSVEPGTAVVVDTGPDPELVDRCLRRLGVRQISYLLLTHFHADHVGGLSGVLRGRRVLEVGVSPLADPPAAAAAVAHQAAAAGARLTVAVPGEQRAVGALRWRVLWPRIVLREGSPANNASVVLLAETPTGLRILLSGDIEPAAQAALHRAEPDLRVDVVKTPHHGSSRQDFAFLRSLGARLAVTSVGADNDYGHPGPLVLQAFHAAGITHLRTDESGDLAVVGVGDRLRAVARR
ncbi:MAG: ComEC/Rec2 family competence protein [Sporichthyaceae bacterium]